MRFYRCLEPFKVMSFDLDDTLYDNTPVIAGAEASFALYLAENYKLPKAAADVSFWSGIKTELSLRDEALCDDVTLLRAHALIEGFIRLKSSCIPTLKEALELVGYFVKLRSDLKVDDRVKKLLNELRAKYTLAAVSNGNVDLKAIGLSDFFNYNLRPAYLKLKKKPYPDLFLQLMELCNVKPQEILHIGDEPFSDVQGAVLAGCQCAFLNKGYAGRLKGCESLMQVPHLVLDNIFELRHFLDGS